MKSINISKKLVGLSLFVGGLSIVTLMLAKEVKAKNEIAQKIVDSIQPEKMQGVYYEIARLPNVFQNEDWVGARDEYQLLDNGDLKVLYKYYEQRFDTEEKVLEARMWREPKDLHTGRFKYQVFWPFVADYWVIDLGANYEYMVIGYPNQQMLWIMSRTPEIEEQTYQDILKRVALQGYDVQSLIRVPQKSNL